MNQHISCVSERNTPLLQCPVCSRDFERHTTQLVCQNNHTFDIARSNYINFHHKQSRSHYNKTLFQARNHLIENGFFQGLESVIVKQLMSLLEEKETLTILDAGCGDGALFSNILLSLRWDKMNINGFGIDIAKEGVHYASKHDTRTIWLVGDLAHLPFKDQSVDVILNNLSPANYLEFKRVLKPDGILIKAIPDTCYLQELQLLLDKNPYSNTNVVSLFEEQMYLCKQLPISDKKQLNNEEKAEVLQMTPLAWGNHLAIETLNKINAVSVDLLVLVGQPK